jgi:hypothetical protein
MLNNLPFYISQDAKESGQVARKSKETNKSFWAGFIKDTKLWLGAGAQGEAKFYDSHFFRLCRSPLSFRGRNLLNFHSRMTWRPGYPVGTTSTKSKKKTGD